jgi:hypothetical protein
MLAVGLALLLCATARAGTYEVWSCADPAGKPAPTEGWSTWFTGPANTVQHVDGCASGEGLYVGLDGHLAPEVGARGAWNFDAPSGATIESFRLWRWSGATVPASPQFTVEFVDVEPSPAGIADIEACDSRAGCAGLGTSTSAFDGGNLLNASNLPAGVTKLGVDVLCAGSDRYCPATGGPPHIAARIYRAAIRLRDDSVPTFLSPPAGSLTAGGPLSGTQSLSFSAADTGSGVQSAELEVDGKTVATQDFGCPPPYVHLTPCKLANGGSLALDTSALADGPHSVRVLVRDATQSNVGVAGPFTITTANTPTSCASEAATNFAVRLDRRGSTIAYGAKLNVSGTLGAVAAGTPVLVQSQVDRPGAPAKLGRTPLLVDAAGRFTYRVPAGPSRTLRFAQRVGGQLTYACSKPLVVNVKARATLKASPRTLRSGHRVRFSGKLLHGYVPAGGKLIELQAYERGRWRSITTLRTNAHGAFSYRYRFSFRASGTTFPVRARVRHDASYPFALGTSPSVRVHVR